MPEPLSQEVTDRVAAQFPEPVRAEVATALLGYRVAPVDFGRLRILDAARGRVADLLRLVEIGNRYGRDWYMSDPPLRRPGSEPPAGEG